MPTEPTSPLSQVPKSLDQLLAEMLRENERLRRQVEDARHERDEYKKMYLAELAKNPPPVSEADIAAAVPAGPVIESMTRRLEGK